jgi:predicted nicotinamide N-methyase
MHNAMGNLMNQENLPAESAALYKKIAKQYTVGFEKLGIREKEFKILRVTDLEPLLAGKDPFKDVSTFPFWVRLWEAAVILADTVAATPARPGQTLLELGAGLGAPGLVAAAAGYKVTLSDYEPHILDFQKVSAAANNLTGIDFQIIDWTSPPDLPAFDTIIGAEILFREDFFKPLLAVFKKLLKPDGVIYLAHDAGRRSLGPFLTLAQNDYNIAACARTMRAGDEKKTIVVNRLIPKEAGAA